MRTPEQKPYFSARFTFIAGLNVSSALNILYNPRSMSSPSLQSKAREPLFTLRFAMLWLYAFVTFFSAFQLLPAIPLRILDLGGSKAQAGWFLSVYTFASAFAAPVMGSIADHIGRRRLLVIASTLFIGFSVAYGLITDLRLLLAVGILHGALWSGILASASAIMSEFIPESRRTQGLSYWGLASTGAVAVAPAVGIVIHHRYGWATLCIELAALSVVMTLWALVMPAHQERRPESRHSLGDSWDWRVVRVTLTLAVVAFGYGGMTSYAAIFAIEHHVKPESIYLTTFAITIVVMRVFFSHLADRLGVKRVLYPTLVLIPFAFAVLGLAHGKEGMIASAILFGTGFGFAYPALGTFVLGATDPRRRARTFGSMVWAFDTGIGLGSFGIGVIGQRSGLSTAFLVAAGLSCLAIPIFMVTSRGLQSGGTSIAGSLEHDGTADS
jgi:predicted MFS family arabinose efflux permease